MKQRFLSWLLTLTMICSFVPGLSITAHADGEGDAGAVEGLERAFGVQLGTSLWESDDHTTAGVFKFPQATVIYNDGRGDNPAEGTPAKFPDKITLLTVTISGNGQIREINDNNTIGSYSTGATLTLTESL